MQNNVFNHNIIIISKILDCICLVLDDIKMQLQCLF